MFNRGGICKLFNWGGAYSSGVSGKQKTTKPLPAIALAQARRAGQRPLRLCGELLQSILLLDYMDIMRRSGWEITHIIDCPMSLRAGGHAGD